MRACVTVLPFEEPARFNPGPLEELCDQIGEVQAEAEVALALDRISDRLSQIPPSISADTRQALCASLTALVEDAELIGMASLARVARDVLACDAFGDEVSFAATLARLRRVGDRSIHAIWDFEDVSG